MRTSALSEQIATWPARGWHLNPIEFFAGDGDKLVAMRIKDNGAFPGDVLAD